MPIQKTTAASPADRLAYVLGTWFLCGRFPKAPGTAGTVGTIPVYLLVRPFGPWAVAAAAALVTAVGVWAADRVARQTGRKDPQIVCIDEAAGVLITWIAAPATWAGLVAGLVLFRVLDMAKPFPARWAERRWPGGWGIVFDDVFAGAWGAAILLAARGLGAL